MERYHSNILLTLVGIFYVDRSLFFWFYWLLPFLLAIQRIKAFGVPGVADGKLDRASSEDPQALKSDYSGEKPLESGQREEVSQRGVSVRRALLDRLRSAETNAKALRTTDRKTLLKHE